MARPKKAETQLLEATEAGDNLAILKAQRLLLVKQLHGSELDVKDQVQLQNSLTRVNDFIIKLEGTKEVFDDEEEEEIALDDVLRRVLRMSQPLAFDEEDESGFDSIEEGESDTD